MKKNKEQPLRIGEIGFTDGKFGSVKLRCFKSDKTIANCLYDCYFSELFQSTCHKRRGKFACSIKTRPDKQNVYYKRIDS